MIITTRIGHSLGRPKQLVSTPSHVIHCTGAVHISNILEDCILNEGSHLLIHLTLRTRQAGFPARGNYRFSNSDPREPRVLRVKVIITTRIGHSLGRPKQLVSTPSHVIHCTGAVHISNILEDCILNEGSHLLIHLTLRTRQAGFPARGNYRFSNSDPREPRVLRVKVIITTRIGHSLGRPKQLVSTPSHVIHCTGAVHISNILEDCILNEGSHLLIHLTLRTRQAGFPARGNYRFSNSDPREPRVLRVKVIITTRIGHSLGRPKQLVSTPSHVIHCTGAVHISNILEDCILNEGSHLLIHLTLRTRQAGFPARGNYRFSNSDPREPRVLRVNHKNRQYFQYFQIQNFQCN